MGRIEYRQARPNELEAIWRLRHDVFIKENGPHTFPHLVGKYKEEDMLPDRTDVKVQHFIAVENDAIVAVLTLHFSGNDVLNGRDGYQPKLLRKALGFTPRADEVAEVGRAFTVKSHRGRGTILLRLFKVATDLFRSQGGRVLVTVIKPGNTKSERLVHAFNWKYFGTVPDVVNFFALSLVQGGSE